MNDNLINAIQDVASDVNGDVRDDYSGRGMMGRECYGIACDNDVECVRLAGKYNLPTPRVDHLGKRYIVYWPRITG